MTAALARRFTTFDRYFASQLSMTMPNREYMHAAQSGGLRDNAVPHQHLQEHPDWVKGFSFPTIWDLLDAGGRDVGVLLLERPDHQHLRCRASAATHATSPPTTPTRRPARCRRSRSSTRSSSLPNGLANDDHPHADIRLGQQFLSDVVTRVRGVTELARRRAVHQLRRDRRLLGPRARRRSSTIPEAPSGFGQLGFRIPAMLVSPWAAGRGPTTACTTTRRSCGSSRATTASPALLDRPWSPAIAHDRSIGAAFGGFTHFDPEVDTAAIAYDAPPVSEHPVRGQRVGARERGRVARVLGVGGVAGLPDLRPDRRQLLPLAALDAGDVGGLRSPIVRFGIFYEHQIPRPWHEDSEYELLHQSLDQIELADRLGYDYAWEVEHHFLEEYSHSSAPEVFLGAASQRTSRIRLGHGIIQLTTNHPARVAERVATLDLVSHGRVELGMGESATTTELHPFDVRFRNKRDVWEDAVRACLPMFWNDAWEYHGEHFDFPLRNVVPKPRQKPHPPLWVACSQLETIRMAGMRGMGALGFQFVSAEAAQAWVHAYYNAYTKHLDKLCEYETNPNIAVVSQFMCAPTDEEARARAEGSSFFQFALGYYATHAPGVPARSGCGRSTSRSATRRRARSSASAGSSGHRRRSASASGGSRSPTSTR